MSRVTRLRRCSFASSGGSKDSQTSASIRVRALPELGEQLAAAQAEEVGHRAGLAVREQDRVHALLQARAVAHQVQPPTGPLPLGAHARVGQPDRRHQIAARERATLRALVLTT
jgi:hypothetical protein